MKELLLTPLIIIIIVGLFVWADHVVMDYRGWVKTQAVADIEYCMVFTAPDAQCAVFASTTKNGMLQVIGSKKCPDAKASYEEAFARCGEYGADNEHWSPFPFWQSLTFSS